jgi:hypothetical protein
MNGAALFVVPWAKSPKSTSKYAFRTIEDIMRSRPAEGRKKFTECHSENHVEKPLGVKRNWLELLEDARTEKGERMIVMDEPEYMDLDLENSVRSPNPATQVGD